MQAKVLCEYVRVSAFLQVEGDWIAEVDINSYEDYKALPPAIEVNGITLGKTGWSSDRWVCVFKSGVLLGKKLDKYA
jgi:hypothetical protein